jgi:hypothetical protein
MIAFKVLILWYIYWIFLGYILDNCTQFNIFTPVKRVMFVEKGCITNA